MAKEIICIIVTLLMIGFTTARQEKLSYDDCWSTLTSYAYDDKSYLITWNGKHISSISTYPCRFGFRGRDYSQILNEYKICIQATEWILHSDNITLKYYSDDSVLNKNLQKTYTKWSSNSPLTEWCSKSDEYVYIELVSSATSDDQGRVTLNIYAVMTFNYAEHVGIIVGSVLGSLTVIGIIITVIIIIACRRKREPGVVLNMTNIGSTITNQPSVVAGVGNGQYKVDTAPPSYYMATHNQYSANPLQNTTQPAPQQT